jgi:multidrug efflux pump subunit AcrA (membrane-fusion protein)
MVQPAGTGPQAVTQAQQSVAQARLALSQARAMLASDTAQLQTDDATLAAAQQNQANDCQGDAAAGSGSTRCASDTAEVASDRKAVDADQQKVTADQDKVATAQLALTNAQAALATAEIAATAYDPTSKYTALPLVGQVIQPGRSLWSVDGRPVALLPGSVTAWRAFAPGMPPGADVAALNQALTQLGFGNGLKASDAFSGATAAAIDRLQASLGVPRTGTLPLGSVVFGATAARVTTVHPLVGNTVVGGQPVLDVTSTTPVVNVALPVGQTSRVKVGDPVSVNLPDGTTGEGTITAVGTVATNTTPSNSGSNNTSATVNVAVSLTKASPAGSLDQAPVTVNITNNSVHQVLAVPTTALLALAGGGYAVEMVEPNGTHQLVGVTTGIFDDQSGLVEVSGSGLAAGQRVVVAS